MFTPAKRIKSEPWIYVYITFKMMQENSIESKILI